jgi:hypothetical protein
LSDGFHGAGLGVENGSGRPDLLVVADGHLASDFLVGYAGHRRIEGGLDGQTAPVDRLDALGLTPPQHRVEGGVLFEPGQDVVTEVGVVGGLAGVLGRGDFEHGRQGHGARGLPVRVLDEPEILHPVQDDVAPSQGLLGEVDRVARAGVLDDPGEQCRFLQVEGLGAVPEVMLGGRLDAVGPVTVVDEVEVALEDLVLGEGLLQLDGVLEFLDLAAVVPRGGGRRPSLVARSQGVLLQRDLDVLLGEGRPTAGQLTGGLVGDEGAQDALQVGAAVLVEAVVLDGDLGRPHDRRDLIQRHDDAVLVVRSRDLRAVGGEDDRLFSQRRGCEVVRERVEEVNDGADRPPDRTDRGQEQPRRQKAGDDCGREERPEEADHAAHVRRSSRHVRKGNAPACIRGPRALSFRYAARPTTSECRRAARPTTLRRRAVGPVLAPAED